MVRGRKPRADAVKEAEGAYKNNPKRRPKTTLKADVRLPVAPSYIRDDKVASAVWDETVDVLKDCGILSKTDTHLLVSYCSTYSEWVKCYTHVSENGHKDDNGKTSPESITFHKLADRHLKLLSELGLSPSSRARLSVAKSEAEEDEENSLKNIMRMMKGA